MAHDLDPLALLHAYDSQLRREAEVRSATRVDAAGPLLRATYPGRGFVTYADLGGVRGADLDALIADTIAHFAADPAVRSFEWKTRGHDEPADLPARLLAYGLVAEEVETVMLGPAAALAVEVPVPAGVRIARAGGPDLIEEARRAETLADEVFGGGGSLVGDDERAIAWLRDGSRQVWFAEYAGEVVCTGRLEPVPGTEFAGLWGGATHPQWRGRGIYRALTAARARAALECGVRYLHCDCTDMSRPILERSGLVAVTTTTPYVWTRPASG